jgi:hypothetical protein
MYLDQLPDIKDARFTLGRKAENQRSKNYVIYCRKSDERDDRTSLPAQLAHCKELAQREGFNVIGVVSEQMSARSPGRPKFGNLLKAIKGEEELNPSYLEPL